MVRIQLGAHLKIFEGFLNVRPSMCLVAHAGWVRKVKRYLAFREVVSRGREFRARRDEETCDTNPTGGENYQASGVTGKRVWSRE